MNVIYRKLAVRPAYEKSVSGVNKVDTLSHKNKIPLYFVWFSFIRISLGEYVYIEMVWVYLITAVTYDVF